MPINVCLARIAISLVSVSFILTDIADAYFLVCMIGYSHVMTPRYISLDTTREKSKKSMPQDMPLFYKYCSTI
jgi:hypothetical protein